MVYMNSFETPVVNNKTENLIPFEINDLENAKEHIKGLYEKGERPTVTVPKKYLENLKQGLKPYATWVGVALIAATFGREPYEFLGEDRVVVSVNDISLDQITPRFTGPNNSFSGVVVLDGPIPPESIHYEI